jgi:PAS domain S-box-containing protein
MVGRGSLVQADGRSTGPTKVWVGRTPSAGGMLVGCERRRAFHSHMKRFHIGRLQYLTALWISGSAALALATWVCFHLGLTSATSACVYLVIIVLLSLMDSFVSSAIFSVIAVACLDYFFIAPLFAFEVANGQDLTTLFAFLVTSLVITSLVRRLRRLGQAHREQAALLDLTRDSVLVRDLKNVITYWNLGGEELYGWKRGEAVGKVTHQLLQTIFPAPLEEISGEFFRTGRWEGELVHTRRDGTRVTVASRWSLQRGKDGEPLGTLETNSDITQRKRAEESLHRIQETYLAEAQQLSHTGSFGWKVSNGQIFWSEEGYRIFGFEPGANPSIELVLARAHPDDRALVQQVVEGAANDRQDFNLEHRLLMPDGSIKHIHVVARAMPDQLASVDFVGAVMDVTAIRRAELELHTTRTELAHVMRVTSLGELTASIAHEVNQPLGAIVANAEASLGWLDRENPDVNEARAAIARIARDGHRAGEVIRRVRALVKKTDAQMVSLQINEIVREAADFVQQELASSQVSLRLDLGVDLMAIHGDRIQLQQVLLNLISNGIEAMQVVFDRPRELVIRSERDGAKQVRVTVTDCGTGLSAENASKIFEPFVTTKGTGMGMGLSICRSIIDAHGGRIWASASEPYGAAIQFTLPAHLGEAA